MMNLKGHSDESYHQLSNQSHESLLPPEGTCCNDQQVSARWRSKLQIPIYLHGILAMLYSTSYVLLLFFTLRPACSGIQAKPAYLPHYEGLVWEQRKFPTSLVDNPFSGNPRPELDEAWHNLLRNDNIKVPKTYLEELNLTSVYTKDEMYGIVSLSVYHSLHCLKKVRRMLFKEYYHVNKSQDSMARELKHVDHCIEYIREALMCQPDLSMVTFRWINNTAQHEDKSAFYPTNFDSSIHRCAKWEALDSWTEERMFNLFEVDQLKRPMPDGMIEH
ncbi:hypothetical protein F4809DRAFT_658881 [Biscogniauxia mediterranea]|nr:hypothetical protein F4809DRAFT_658881 [Biscogniauxia mediterranea]